MTDRRSGPVVTVAATTLSVATLLWALVRVFGLERGTPAVQLMAFTPWVAVWSLVLLVVALVLRRWWAVAAAALACVLLGASVAPRAVAGAPAPAGATLRVMSINMRIGGASAVDMVGLVAHHGVDVLTVQELTVAGDVALSNAGLAGVLSYSCSHPEDGAGGSAVYSLHPISDCAAEPIAGGFRQASATVRKPGARPVIVTSVHPRPPMAAALADWASGLRGEPPAGAGDPRILAGDFNATLDHVALRRLLATGYQDAAAAVGAGLVPTWPYYGPRSALTPKVTIDHVLVDNRLGVSHFAVHPVAFTDHRAIIATLVLPAASGQS